MQRPWYSGKALLLHLSLAGTVTLCLVAGWWQVNRARSGNLLSYGYAVEWPVFAGVAILFWWQLVHDDPGRRTSQPRPAEPTRPQQRRREQESPQLRAYNDDLSALAAKGRPKTWRNPKGLP
ncbi:MAG: hypothetical protein M3011_06950 [Actinomycetota bacterium]|nr:hypothetical protein [Actinomycetota bacterium]